MSKKEYKILFVFFLCLNIFLVGNIVYGKYLRPTSPTDNNKTEHRHIFNEDNNANLKIPELTKAFSDNENENKLKLFLFFPGEYCGSCINMELEYLKSIYNNYESTLMIINKNNSYNLDTMISGKSKSETEIDSLEISNELFSNSGHPIILLSNKNGNVISIYESIIGREQERINFYEKVNFILDLNYNKN